MKKKILLLAAGAFLITGCAEKYDPTPKAINIKKKEYHQFDIKISVKKGESFKNVLHKIKEDNKDKIILDKTKTNIIFTEDLNNLSPKDLFNYIKLNYGITFQLRKYSPRLYVVDEHIEKKIDLRFKGDMSRIPNINLEIKGGMTYAELFNELRSQNINIYTELNEKDGSFKPSNTVKEFKGKLPELLKLIASEENLFVRVGKDGSICLEDLETRNFDLKLPKIKEKTALNADGGISSSSIPSSTDSSSSSVSSSSLNGTSSSGEVDPLSDLSKEIDAIFSGDKNIKYFINKSSGVLTVTASYKDMKRMSIIIKKFQDIYSKHIQIEMHVYEITLNDHNAFGVDYSMLGDELMGNGLKVASGLSTGLTSSLPTSVSNSAFLTVLNAGTENSAASGKTSGILFKYLNKFGRASILTKPMLGTVNNFPVRLDVINSKDYVYKISQTQTGTATNGTQTNVTTTEPEIKTIQTGFSLVLHPRIEGDYIKIAMKNIVSNLNGLTQIKYGQTKNNPEGNTLQLKDVSSREFEETVKLKEGEMAIIGGYQYTKQASTKAGLPLTTAADSSFDALTSAKDRQTEKVEIVMTLQAVAR